MTKKHKLLRATKAEQTYISEFASRSAFDRIDEGQLEVVSSADIPPEIQAYMRRRKQTLGVRLNKNELNLLDELSRKLNQTPSLIIARWTREKLRSIAK